jgi:putative ribosome biogenesis GTPase RsgA
MTKITELEEKFNELDKKLDKIILITDNIQTNYIKFYDEFSNFKKDIQTRITDLRLKQIEIETNLQWIQKLKIGIYVGGSGIGLVSLIELINYFKNYIK